MGFKIPRCPKDLKELIRNVLCASVAQSVERYLGKVSKEVKVVSSILI